MRMTTRSTYNIQQCYAADQDQHIQGTHRTNETILINEGRLCRNIYYQRFIQ